MYSHYHQKFSILILAFGAVISAAIIFFPYFVQAQVEGKFFQSEGIAEWINKLYLWSAGIVGILAVVTLVFAGIQYLSSVGNQDMIKQAQTKIGAGIAGLLLVLLSYTILRTLDPRLVKIGFKVEELNLEMGSNIHTLTMKVPDVEKIITAEDPTKAQDGCQKECGKVKVLSVEKGNGNDWKCKCEGATVKASCTNDADCEKICKEKNGEEACKKLNIYCNETKKCDFINRNTNSNLLADGKTCEEDMQCQSGKCANSECGKPLAGGAHCEKHTDCQSGKCYFAGRNECIPVGGFEAGHGCQIENSDFCKSGKCIDRPYQKGDICSKPEGQSWFDECNPITNLKFYEKTKDVCDTTKGLYCEPSSDNDFGVCRCIGETTWSRDDGKCT